MDCIYLAAIRCVRFDPRTFLVGRPKANMRVKYTNSPTTLRVPQQQNVF